jgi:RecA/RadA recombinase
MAKKKKANTNIIFDKVAGDEKLKSMMEECYYSIEEDEADVKFVSTSVATINLMLSGRANGGIPIGKMSMISAPSMLGKSFVAMATVKNAQRMGMSVCIIDTERAFSYQLAKALNIDTESLYVFQDSSLEKINNFILRVTDKMTKAERKNTLFVIDSWGTLVTSKTLEDGLDGKDVKDMTITQKKNNLANVILNTRGTFLIINHVYDQMSSFSSDPFAIPGGKKAIFNSDCVIMGMTRAKDTKDENVEGVGAKKKKKKILKGQIIKAKSFKSRYAKEQTALSFRIKHDGGLDPFYGLLEDAVLGGYVVNSPNKDGKPMKGKWSRGHIKDDDKFKEDEIYTSSFWGPIFKDTDFYQFLETKYRFSSDLDMAKDEDEILDILG